MLKFSLLLENVEKMDYDAIVTNTALRKRFSYNIPEEKIKLDRRGKLKKTKIAGSSQPTVPGVSSAKKVSKKNEQAKRVILITRRTLP